MTRSVDAELAAWIPHGVSRDVDAKVRLRQCLDGANVEQLLSILEQSHRHPLTVLSAMYKELTPPELKEMPPVAADTSGSGDGVSRPP